MSQPPYQVLLVEDDLQMQDVLTTLLAEDDVRLVCARNSEEALDLVAQKTFELIVLDLGLPGKLNGFDILAQLKSDPQTESIPVIILTAWNRTEDKLRGFGLGACDYLTKPFEAAELRARLRAALRTRRLQEELSQSNRDLITARLTAEASARNKAEFLATMSHEIRTPMNGVIAMSSLLMDTPLNHEQRGYVETIHTCSESLLSIINEILDFSKIESGKLELESHPFDLRRCIEDALDLLAPKAAEKKLDLAYQMDDAIPGQLLGDVNRLRQVFVNLVNNAIKFTASGEVFLQVTIHAAPAVDGDQPADLWQLHIAVRDTGIGIPPDRMARLFKPFTQANASTAREFGGTGLGLAISKRIVELMNGKLWAESTLNKGSTFHLIVPFHAASADARAPMDKQQPHLASQRLLIVDDNSTNCRILSTQAGKWGMIPRGTQSAAQALQWLDAGEIFDLAILDMQMPEMDGVTLAQKIRKLAAGGQFPIVLLTSVGVRTDSPEFTGVAFASCLTKPIKPAQLQDAITRIISGNKPAPAKTGGPAKMDRTLATRLPLRILLCDDNQINLKVALRILQQLGYKADTALNGREAVEAFERQPYDLVFMDVQMPEVDGFEATRRIRERQQQQQPNFKSSIIIVAITASVMKGDRERCIASGMDDYLAKPIRPEDVRQIIERWATTAALPDQTEHTVEPAPLKTANAADENAPVDMDRMLDFSDNDPESLRELVALYFKQTTTQMEELATAIKAADASGVQRVAHSCAGASATCGMIRIAPLLRELEKQGHDRDLSAAVEKFTQVTAEFERIKKYLTDYLAAQSAPQKLPA